MIHDKASAKKMLLYLLENADISGSSIDYSCEASAFSRIAIKIDFVLPQDFEYEVFHETMVEKKEAKKSGRFDNLDLE